MIKIHPKLCGKAIRIWKINCLETNKKNTLLPMAEKDHARDPLLTGNLPICNFLWTWWGFKQKEYICAIKLYSGCFKTQFSLQEFTNKIQRGYITWSAMVTTWYVTTLCPMGVLKASHINLINTRYLYMFKGPFRYDVIIFRGWHHLWTKCKSNSN